MFILNQIKNSLYKKQDIDIIDGKLKKKIIKIKIKLENWKKFIDKKDEYPSEIKEKFNNTFTSKFIFVLNYFNNIMESINLTKDYKILLNLYTIFFSCFIELFEKIIDINIDKKDIKYNLFFMNNSDIINIKYINSNIIKINNINFEFNNFDESRKKFITIFFNIFLKNWPIISLNSKIVIGNFVNNILNYLENLQNIDLSILNKQFDVDSLIDKKNEIFKIFEKNIVNNIIINILSFQNDSELFILNQDLITSISILNNKNFEKFEDLILSFSKSY